MNDGKGEFQLDSNFYYMQILILKSIVLLLALTVRKKMFLWCADLNE